MFYKSPLPRGILIRASVLVMVFTTVFAGSFSSLPIGNTRVSAALPFAPPANDNYANAQPMLGVSGLVTGTTVGATKEPLEQNIEGIAGTGSVWYKWQAPFSGRFVFITSDSNFSHTNFNTLLGVYSGANLPGIQVRANDDDIFRCPTISFLPTLSRVAFDAVGGLTYHIAVDTKGTGGGTFTLRWGRSATIAVHPFSVSNGPNGGAAGSSKLDGDMCSSLPSTFIFQDVPTGGSYNVSIVPSDPLQGYGFAPSKENGSTSPLTGDITLTFYLMSPTKSIFGRVTNLPGPDITGLTINCVSTNGALVTQSAKFTVLGPDAFFECSSLPINGEYRVTPSKLGFSFVPADTTVTLFGDIDLSAHPFVATAQLLRTISGRVTLPNGTTSVSGATVALTGSQADSKTTDSNGNYSFTVPYGGNYSVTPSHSNFTFTPLSRSFSNVIANQTGDFAAAFVLQLILDDSGQVAALDSLLHTRDPFPVIDLTNLLNQGNTRVAIFVSNFQLGPSELPSSVVINLVGSNNQTYDIPAEDVRSTSNPTFTQVIFRLPDTLTPGICTLFVKAHGLTSNIGAMNIRS